MFFIGQNIAGGWQTVESFLEREPAAGFAGRVRLRGSKTRKITIVLDMPTLEK